MKTIVISGDHSDTGKTTLAHALAGLLKGADTVKIGTGIEDNGKKIRLFRPGDTFEQIAAQYPDTEFLIIESNSILTQITPDLCIFLPGDGEPKESAVYAREHADLIRGGSVTCPEAHRLAAHLGVPAVIFGKLLDIVQVKLTACDFGVF